MEGGNGVNRLATKGEKMSTDKTKKKNTDSRLGFTDNRHRSNILTDYRQRNEILTDNRHVDPPPPPRPHSDPLDVLRE